MDQVRPAEEILILSVTLIYPILMFRIMLEMGTGLNTAIHMTEPHKDGGSLVTMSHHALLDPAEPDPGWWYKIDSHRR